uniref:Uncharacterized protein n=1 Tax=Hyaloperonospora arabidopsidis (strain Emoy2) TaxID=559515 RepID=M4B579_HYAAE
MVSREDSRQEMKIRFDDGTEATVSRDRVRRLSEYLIRKVPRHRVNTRSDDIILTG